MGDYRVEIVDTSIYNSIQTGEPGSVVVKNQWFYYCDLGFCISGEGVNSPPGDCDGSGVYDVDDVVCMIDCFFLGYQRSWCLPYSSDADGSGSADIDDMVYLICYLFAGGPAPPTCIEWAIHSAPICED